uniref:Uncharacterized protein n=1 Tax=Marinitoga okinawensis TaxID=389480 RepID=A0A9C7GWE1_9BACT|nr:hypothetical protein [Marinitoga okinawensis]CAI4093955.1 Hypothetical protein PMO1_03 [Marinitoga okinawensis]
MSAIADTQYNISYIIFVIKVQSEGDNVIDDFNLNKLGYSYGLAVKLDYPIRLKILQEN